MLFDDPRKFVKNTKGAPLSVYILLCIATTPITAKDICVHSGYSENSVTKALKLLEDYKLITCDSHRSSWQLTNGVIQIPLGIELMPQTLPPNRENCDPTEDKESIIIIIDDDPPSEESIITIDTESRNSRSQELTEALRAVGIVENQRTTPLYNSEILTPDHVYGHHAKLHEVSEDYKSGRLVLALELVKEEDQIPNHNTRTKHPPKCHCEPCHMYQRHMLHGSWYSKSQFDDNDQEE